MYKNNFPAWETWDLFERFGLFWFLLFIQRTCNCLQCIFFAHLTILLILFFKQSGLNLVDKTLYFIPPPHSLTLIIYLFTWGFNIYLHGDWTSIHYCKNYLIWTFRSRPTNPSPLNSIRITSPMRYISPSAFLPPPSPPPTPSPFRSVSNFFFSHSPSPPSTPNSPFSPTASKFIFPSPSPPSFPTISPSPSPSPPPTPANDFRKTLFLLFKITYFGVN